MVKDNNLTISEQKLKDAESLAKTEPDEALRLCSEVLNTEFDSKTGMMAVFLVGYIMLQAERFGLAYNLFKHCLSFNPNLSAAYLNMGMCLEQDFPEKAMTHFQKAHSLEPDNYNAIANIALMHLRFGSPNASIEWSNRALKINPEMVAAKYNRGLANIMAGNYQNGWDDYSKTLGVKARQRRDYGLPEWNGEKGQIIVYAEQGIGDEVMFASCLSDLQKTNDIIFDCDERLASIFRRSFDFPIYGTRFKSDTPIRAEHNPSYQMAIGQLPGLYRNDESEFPGVPFLKPDPERVTQWKSILPKGVNVGLAWTGGLPSTGKRDRSITLDDLEPILSLKDKGGINFFNLEYSEVDDKELSAKGIKNYRRAVIKGCDIEETFALISALDCIVCVPTAVMHFAGSMGKPCHVICPKYPPYIIGCKGKRFPWYNSVNLYRGNGNISDIAQSLEKEMRLINY